VHQRLLPCCGGGAGQHPDPADDFPDLLHGSGRRGPCGQCSRRKRFARIAFALRLHEPAGHPVQPRPRQPQPRGGGHARVHRQSRGRHSRARAGGPRDPVHGLPGLWRRLHRWHRGVPRRRHRGLDALPGRHHGQHVGGVQRPRQPLRGQLPAVPRGRGKLHGFDHGPHRGARPASVRHHRPERDLHRHE